MPEKLTLLPRGGLAREYEDGVGPDRILVRDERGVEHWVDPYGERGQQSVPGRPHLTVVSILERPDERGIPRYRLGVVDHGERAVRCGILVARSLFRGLRLLLLLRWVAWVV